ncbi:MAG TPA: hypothetical protein VIQ77_06140 [Mucilaginibacter sp.]
MELDSFSIATYGESADEHVKKMTDAVIAKALLDTVGLSKAPVKVVKVRIIQQEYSNPFISFPFALDRTKNLNVGLIIIYSQGFRYSANFFSSYLAAIIKILLFEDKLNKI